MSYQMIKEKLGPKLFLDGYDYNVWPENEEGSNDEEESEDLPLMPP